MANARMKENSDEEAHNRLGEQATALLGESSCLTSTCFPSRLNDKVELSGIHRLIGQANHSANQSAHVHFFPNLVTSRNLTIE